MSEQDALLAGALADPADDTARVVLADWLDESGDPDRARFLRAGVTAARFRDEPFIDAPDYFRALADLAAVAESGAPARWLSTLGVGPSPLTHTDWAWDNTGDRMTVRIGETAGTFARGMLAELVAPLADWYEFASRAFAACPLECGTVTDVPGLRFYIEPPAEHRATWRLSAALTRQPRRRSGPVRRLLTSLVGPEDVPWPVPATRWAAERMFPDRAALAARMAVESLGLVGELRAAAGEFWPPPRRHG